MGRIDTLRRKLSRMPLNEKLPSMRDLNDNFQINLFHPLALCLNETNRHQDTNQPSGLSISSQATHLH